ncbi:YlbF family regulator [Streptococcus pantholopis]|uniref:Cell fate regulator YmcA, YheA/YmcA/DUF963 family (Controls sporulation, competence, biofilm development) n=1 Tax=Streptococcus pantholopis TaxID=1811193 RepID=A0A172QAL1_9STRE|nr:YlbF family regulator [Streptococcus pantholopis]AND80491.1 hypothetical protein A0O21_09325 [Streptococcus pantholopis]
MRQFEESVEKLLAAVRKHDSVQAFQKAEQHVKELPELERLAHKMKAYQQDAVLFQKIEKDQAASQAGYKADELEQELSRLPVVQDYREKMQDASDLLQYITKTLEEKINKELIDDK